MSDKIVEILFLDKVLMGPVRKSPRGVEVFNLNLMRDLAALGIKITVLAHETWIPLIDERAGVGNVEVVVSRTRAKGNFISAIRGAMKLRKRKFSILLLANVANRMIPALDILRIFKVAPRSVLIAHSDPSKRYLATQAKWSTAVLSVNKQIADHFVSSGFSDVAVGYGVTDAGRFVPADHHADNGRGVINLCVQGHLDSAWKGADTAMAAFKELPDDVKDRCCLHLASYQSKPVFEEDNIVAHNWMAYDYIPEFMRKMHVMIVPSRDEEVMRETFSQAMVQGMLTGLPIIANDLPVLTEKLDNGGGIIFKSVEDLRDAIVLLVRNPDMRLEMGRQARETAIARYIWNTNDFANKYLLKGLSY